MGRREGGFDGAGFREDRDSADEHGSPREQTGIRLLWSRSDRSVPRLVLRPLQTFVVTEYAGGLLLLAATVAALVWANSPWGATYDRAWRTRLRIGVGTWQLSYDLREWINDALMVLFFFVVGLEIKRELVRGEFRDRKAAVLPALGAVGGMVVPALLYLAINGWAGGDPAGWAVPMATDIAFAAGVLALVSRGLPPGLKAFLLALAIVDDIGAILVIALFYSRAIGWAALGAAVVLLLAVAGVRRLEVRHLAVYATLGTGVWLATLRSGVHPTIAGVALGLLTPAVPFQRARAVGAEARRIADRMADAPEPADADAPHWLRLGRLSREAVSPLARLEEMLHPWTSFLVVPLFALANAGVRVGPGRLARALSDPIAVGVLAGLVVGKPLGISAAAVVGVHLGAARLPPGVRWGHLVGAGAVAGIGFTVSLFITDLAFAREASGDAARVAVLVASVAAALLGGAALRAAGRVRRGRGLEPPAVER